MVTASERALHTGDQSVKPLTALHVAQLTGAEWAEALLSNDNVLRSLCLAEFGAADTDRSGTLDRDEAWQCIVNICSRFRLDNLPRRDRCEELYNACDTNADGSLQCHEFKCFFSQVLKACVRKIRTSIVDVSDGPDAELDQQCHRDAASTVRSCLRRL